MNCPHCKQELEYQPGEQYYSRATSRVYDLYCKQCDLYYAKNWNSVQTHWLHFTSFESSEREGVYIRRHRIKETVAATMFDKPAPYCLLQNHVPQIRVDNEFHEWYSGFKLRARDGPE